MSSILNKILGVKSSSDIDEIEVDESHVVTQEDLSIIEDTSISIMSTLSFEEVLQKSIDRLVLRYKFLGGLLFLIEKDYVYAKTISGSVLAEAFLKLIGKPITDLHIQITENSENYVVKTIQTGKVYSSDNLYDFTKGVLNQSLSSTAGFVTRTHSFISVPINHQGKTIGAMFFSKSSSEGFDKEIKLLTLIASQIGIAIANARLYSDLKKQYEIVSLKNTQLDSINKFTNKIISNLDPEQVVQEALDIIPDLFGNKYIGTLYANFDKEKRILGVGGYSQTTVTEAGFKLFGVDPRAIRISLDDKRFENHLNSQVVRSGEIIFTDKLHDLGNGLANELIIDKVQQFINLTALVAVPIRIKNKIVGVLDFFMSGITIDEIKERELDTIKIITNQLSTVLENASLYHQVDIALSELKEKNEKLEEKYQFEKDMMGILGHELRSPMTVARGMAELVIEKAKNSSNIENDYLIDKLNKIYTSVIKESDLIQTLLSASHLDNNKLVFNLGEFNFKDLVEFAVMTFKKDAEEKKIELTSHVPDGDLILLSDQSRIQEVVNNLISNAIKYTDTGFVKVVTRLDNDFIEFSVEDSGIGISEKELPNIGKRFYRVNEVDKSRQKTGTGLGLYVVKGILENMGGKLVVESEVNKGSKFTAFIPTKAKVEVSNTTLENPFLKGDMFEGIVKK